MSDCDPGYCQYEAMKADYAALQAKADRLAEALDKALLAACWYHEGPYGPSPSIEDYRASQAALAAYREGE